jgi:hypothetical protein
MEALEAWKHLGMVRPGLSKPTFQEDNGSDNNGTVTQ